ncbi:EVE domain-containing protein [Parachlamydia sp. AcF125]|uniref:EVE domain-containing protein n=1 Tax=Parachlamydia sp. AcF125 TaxID=2795736 RepID=UPI001BCA14C0|nr:EVE domain-containing protein [Parachlamydia sp. AcF125]MBS4168308.1 hypothetical protein [Parachlamydia sp. AcF125]
MIKYWLMKSEPSVYSIDNLKQDGFTLWDGVRNYQARNYMRDEMEVGDLALFYHSNVAPPGVAGICRICKTGLFDLTALDPASPYYDKRATLKNPIWATVEVEYVEKFPYFVSLMDLKDSLILQEIVLLNKGSRLSIIPIKHEQFDAIRALGHSPHEPPAFLPPNFEEHLF